VPVPRLVSRRPREAVAGSARSAGLDVVLLREAGAHRSKAGVKIAHAPFFLFAGSHPLFFASESHAFATGPTRPAPWGGPSTVSPVISRSAGPKKAGSAFCPRPARMKGPASQPIATISR